MKPYTRNLSVNMCGQNVQIFQKKLSKLIKHSRIISSDSIQDDCRYEAET